MYVLFTFTPLSENTIILTEFHTSKKHYGLSNQKFRFRRPTWMHKLSLQAALLTSLSAECPGRARTSWRGSCDGEPLDCPDFHQAYLLNVIKPQPQAGLSFLLKGLFHYKANISLNLTSMQIVLITKLESVTNVLYF